MHFPASLSKLVRSITTSTLTQTKPVPFRESNNLGTEAEQNCLALLETIKTFSNLTQAQARLLKSGLHNNPLLLTKFASTSSNIHAIDYASSFLFSPECETRLYDTFLYNTIVRAYAQTNDSKEKAIYFFNLMLRNGVLPNKYTYPFVLKACSGLRDLNLGKSVHGSALKFGLDDSVHVRNTMVNMYCCDREGVGFARHMFDEMPKLHSVSWSAMIGGYVRLGMSNDAIEVFREMQIARVRPDEITMVLVLSACTDMGALELGKWVEGYIEKEKMEKSIELCNALIDMFANCGDVDKAIELFHKMAGRTVVSWTSMIVGLAMNGRGIEAVDLFEEMVRSGVFPDDVVFIGLLSACSHSGLVEKGKEYFNSMRKVYGIIPKIEHYGCVVDMLCRGGRVKEALEFVQEMPIEPNPIIWRTLVNSCRAPGELELGESISEQLIIHEPMRESNYVLLSNIYAKRSDWEKKTRIREAMDKKGMRKIPGSTMIEFQNQIYEFVAGDKSHEQNTETHGTLDELGREMQKAGYVPTASEVLLDIDDEDKKDN